MNEQLQTALAEILSRATQGIDAGTQFLSAQLPDVIQQLLVWKASKSALLTLLGVIGLAVLWKIAERTYKAVVGDDDLKVHPEVMFLIFLTLPALGCAALMSFDWLQILIAPKLYLIEYAASLAK